RATPGRMVEEPAEILRRKARGQRVRRARVQEIEADLRGLHDPCVEHLVQRRSLAERGHAVEADLARFDETNQRGHDGVAYVLDRHAAAHALACDEVVALQQIYALEPESREALVERACDGRRQLRRRHVRHAELRTDIDARLERAQHAAEIRLRLAVAVERRGVEVIEAEVHGAGDGPLLLGGRAAHEQTAHVAAAEAENADAQSRPPERAIVHTSVTSGRGSYNDVDG